MTAIELRPVTVNNYTQVFKLTVSDPQKAFVASNVYSIAQAHFYPSWQPRAVYDGDTMVGFIMWGRDEDLEVPQWWIIRLMVDEAQQGKGYGKAAVQAAIEQIRQEPGGEAIYISFVPQNERALRLYSDLGFKDTGEIDEGELVYKLTLVE